MRLPSSCQPLYLYMYSLISCQVLYCCVCPADTTSIFIRLLSSSQSSYLYPTTVSFYIYTQQPSASVFFCFLFLFSSSCQPVYLYSTAVSLYIYTFAQQLSDSTFIHFPSNCQPLYLYVCPATVNLCIYGFSQRLSALYLYVCAEAIGLYIYAFAQ